MPANRATRSAQCSGSGARDSLGGEQRRDQRARRGSEHVARDDEADGDRGRDGEKAEHVVAGDARRLRRDHQARGEQRREHGGADHEQRHQPVDLGPGPAAALARIDPDEGDAARDDHRQPVAEDVERRAEAALGCCQQVGPVGVDDDVLRCRQPGDEAGEQRERGERGRRRRRRHPEQRAGERELGEDEPAAPASEPRRLEPVHQRRPEELERVRQADQAQEADRREVDAVGGQPCLHRLAGERERQPRCEAEDRDRNQSVQRAPGRGARSMRREPAETSCGHSRER